MIWATGLCFKMCCRPSITSTFTILIKYYLKQIIKLQIWLNVLWNYIWNHARFCFLLHIFFLVIMSKFLFYFYLLPPISHKVFPTPKKKKKKNWRLIVMTFLNTNYFDIFKTPFSIAVSKINLFLSENLNKKFQEIKF